ncbi:MAG: UDP-N-acetylglucosamine 4,6-dehydratase (inverting) [Deltaproteobacteria bacterium]|nr:UDP-N-acetylglucosamine 4,6-dehydratase (inverting) [Deltaproteobacteria bacterium]
MSYKIREVSRQLEVPTSTIRYWEAVFSNVIRPERTEGGQRRYSVSDMQLFSKIKDLLYRENRSIAETKTILTVGQHASDANSLESRIILLTGGTGSFGRHFCKVMFENYHPAVIRIYSRDELKQHEMRQVYGDKHIRYFIGDVRDPDRLKRAMEGADVVVHAAALKQVPSCEYNPFEAVKTNIHGAENVIDAAIDTGVKKVVALSTDKAVNPVNLYGATKLCADKLFIQGNSYSGARGTRFCCVRYGNVIGSRGSVIPLFREQRKTGKITITDPRMSRFWITLDQAVELVVKALRHAQGGEIFVPKIPSMKIVDLAEAIAPGCDIEFTGIRPGEKIHEILITEEEGRNTVDYNDMYVIMPTHSWWERTNYNNGRSLPDGFVYRSDNNSEWLTVDDLRQFIFDSSASEEDPAARLLSTIHRLNEKVILNLLNAEEGYSDMNSVRYSHDQR